MQTYTHALIGAAIGVISFPNNLWAQAACVLGSVVPDLTMVPRYAMDMLSGRPPLANQSTRLMVTKEIGHSLIVWSILVFASLWWNSVLGLAFSVGGLTHAIVDVLTHGTGRREDRPYWDTDVKFMWPTSADLRPLGVWEYRIATGVLRPKLPEAVACIVLIGAIAYLW